MRTTKPISTISFNSPAYLEHKLTELAKAGLLSFWCFVQHLPEDDESGKKEHMHVFIEPSKMVQTDELRESLKEFDPLKPDKPLGCLSFRTSKFADWYMYALHDEVYLSQHDLERLYHYGYDDVQASDPDDLLFRVRTINRLEVSPYKAMQEAYKHGMTMSEYFAKGNVPFAMVRNFERAWALMVSAFEEQEYRRHQQERADGEIVTPDGFALADSDEANDNPWKEKTALKQRLVDNDLWKG